MFLLNNCKLLIFSDVRHGPAASHKRQELVNFGIQKSGCGWGSVHGQRAQVGDSVAGDTVAGDSVAVASMLVAEATVTNRGGCGEQQPCRNPSKLQSVT